MLCHQCGSPVETKEGFCPNCDAELRSTKRLRLSESRGVRISQELKAIRLEEQLFPPGEEVAKRFVLGEMIGKGPFGEVYRARDQAIDAEVAVKIFDAEVIATPLDEERFLQATRAGRRLTQQNVVRLHDSGVHKGHPWVSMQLLEGLSLRKVLDLRRSKNETFAVAELEPVVAQITLALQHISRDFPHGDLKPENVVFLPDLIKVTDTFLFAALPARSIIPRLEDNPYFAPELHTEKSEPSPRADVYSVGVIIGEMLFGADYAPGSRSDGEFAAIDALVKRATAFDPKERYATVEALSEDLATVIDTGAGLARRSEPPPPPGSGMAPPAPPMGPAPSSEASEGDDVATIEYNRELEQRFQNELLTREVGRGPKLKSRAKPLAAGRTVTAAVPKPQGHAPTARPMERDAPVKMFAFLAVLFVLGAFGVWATKQSAGDVEHIGEAPIIKEKTPVAVPPKPEPKPEVAPSVEAVAATAIDHVKSAHTAAQTTLTSSGDPTTKVEPDRGQRPPDEKKDGTGAAKPVAKPDPKPTGTSCKGGMRLVKSKKLGNFCVDRHEYPKVGAKPKTGVSWFQAKKLCESKGKRLCKLKEWRSACGSRYPYGKTHDANKCNTADEDGFERSLAPAGKFTQCARVGVYDMVGNAHEWVHEQRIAGGGFESDEDVGSCRYSSPKSPASSAAYIGFRCCSTPD